MAIPLLWLGAAAATYAGIKYSSKVSQYRGYADVLPGGSLQTVKPVNGAIICCEVYGVLDHTGIWVEDSIIELNGNGLVRSISPERFLADRSGEVAYIACDATGSPMISENTQINAVKHIYQYRNYDLFSNNCHRFVWEMLSDIREPVHSFTDLNKRLSAFHQGPVSWLKLV